MRILVMGGTRFIGVYLTRLLVERGHEVVLFNRGNKPAPVEGIKTIQGDRKDSTVLKEKLSGETFDAVFDNNGRELSDTQPLIELFNGKLQHFVYVSSAGVYLKSDEMPHIEGDAVDPNSRHKGKFATEEYLASQGVPFTSVRPVYIYGPQNYNDVEAWFFDRVVRDRPVPIPGNGMALTQMGHVADLARAMRSGKSITFRAKRLSASMDWHEPARSPRAKTLRHYSSYTTTLKPLILVRKKPSRCACSTFSRPSKKRSRNSTGSPSLI